MARRSLSLHKDWQFREVEPSEVSDFASHRLPRLSPRGWLEAVVPGRVQSDLFRLEHLPHPFAEDNESKWFPIEKNDFVYRTSFFLPDTWQTLLGKSGQRIDLNFSELDTFASVYLNGQYLFSHTSEFCPVRKDVTELLKAGENILVVYFDSALKISSERERIIGPLNAKGDRSRVYTRRSSMRTGTEVSPRLSGVGICGDVELLHYRGLRIREPFFQIKKLSREEAKVILDIGIESLSDQTVELEVILERLDPIGSERQYRPVLVADNNKTINLKKGRFQFQQGFKISEPAIWWPLGCDNPGRRPLYRAYISARRNGELCDSEEVRFGLRTVDLTKEEDESLNFPFLVNGNEIYIRGTTLLATELLDATFSEEKSVALAERIAAANMNLVRIWGGSSYAPTHFMERCDELGILVWQEFPFYAGEYPETKNYWKFVQHEVTHQIRRLRNHPSLMIWVGNADCDKWLVESGNKDSSPNAEKPKGAKIFNRLIAQLLQDFDPSRPYRLTSPMGGKTPNDLKMGDCHLPHQRVGSFGILNSIESPFISQFGIDSLPGREAVDFFNPKMDPMLQDPITQSHDRSGISTQEMTHLLGEWCRIPQTVDESIYLTQWVQGRILREAIDYWRASRPLNKGVIQWHLNETWPSLSCSLIDWNNRPKLSYWAMREANAAVSLIMLPAEQGVRCAVVSDNSAWTGNQNVTLRLKTYQLDGKLLNYHDKQFEMKPNGKTEVGVFSEADLKWNDCENCCVVGELFKGQRHVIASRLYSFKRPKEILFPEPNIYCKLDFVLGRQRAVYLVRSKNIVRGLEVDIPGIPGAVIRQENGIDLWPSREVWLQVNLPGDVTREQLLEGLRFRTLNDQAPGRTISWRPLVVDPSEENIQETQTDFDSQTIVSRLRTTDVIPKLFDKKKN